VLKKLLASLVSLRLIEAPDVKMIDGCAQLWYVNWPSSGTIEGFLILFFQKLERYLNSCDIVLIFDRYFFYSTKDAARDERQRSAKLYSLTLDMPIPARNNILGNCRNKAQLIDLLCTEAKSYFSTNPSSNKLIISGGEKSPVEIQDGKVVVRDDLTNTLEEADTIIIHHTNVLIKEGYKQCHVL